MRSRQINIKGQSELMKKLSLLLLPHKYAACQFHPDKHIPYWALIGDFVSLTRTHTELSIVCQQDNVPDDIKAERGWRCLQVQGAFDFSVAGVQASLTIPLAEADISVLAIATYATTYLLIKEEDVERASQVLKQAGHYIER